MSAKRGPKIGSKTVRTIIHLSPQIKQELEQFLVDGVADNVAILQKLAREGFVTVEETEVPVSLIFRKVGKTEQHVFPELVIQDPFMPIMIQRVTKRHGADMASLRYLIDRVLGKPKEEVGLEEESDNLEFILDLDTGSVREMEAQAKVLEATTPLPIEIVQDEKAHAD